MWSGLGAGSAGGGGAGGGGEVEGWGVAGARAGVHGPIEFLALDHFLHDMRLYKSRSEVRVMRTAAKVACSAHRRAMQACRPGMHEYEVEAELLHEFRRAGMEPAYPGIVGGGENGCILHYTANNSELLDGDLLLIDAGAEYDCYASDVTRTFPVNGRFSDAQRALYEVVLAAQLAAEPEEAAAEPTATPLPPTPTPAGEAVAETTGSGSVIAVALP